MVRGKWNKFLRNSYSCICNSRRLHSHLCFAPAAAAHTRFLRSFLSRPRTFPFLPNHTSKKGCRDDYAIVVWRTHNLARLNSIRIEKFCQKETSVNSFGTREVESSMCDSWVPVEWNTLRVRLQLWSCASLVRIQSFLLYFLLFIGSLDTTCVFLMLIERHLWSENEKRGCGGKEYLG